MALVPVLVSIAGFFHYAEARKNLPVVRPDSLSLLVSLVSFQMCGSLMTLRFDKKEAPWHIKTALLLYPSGEGQRLIQIAVPFASELVLLTPDEQAAADALWEQARRFPQEEDMIWYCLHTSGSPCWAEHGRFSSETLCLVPLLHAQEVMGILRLHLRGIFPNTIKDAGEALLQTKAFLLVRDLAASLLHQKAIQHELVVIQVQQQREQFAEMLLAALSHGFKTPLTALQLTAENWLGEAHVQEDQQSSLLLFKEQIVRLNQHLTNLLLFCQLETKRLLLRRVLYPLDFLLAEVIDQMRQEEEGRMIHLSLPAEIPPLELDPSHIHWVMSTLLRQVAFALPLEMPFEVKVHVQKAEVLIGLLTEGTPFGQSPLSRPDTSAMAPNQERWWLDLTVSKQLVNAHGGRLWVETGEDGWTKIFLTLPRTAWKSSLPSSDEERG